MDIMDLIYPNSPIYGTFKQLKNENVHDRELNCFHIN